MSERRPDPDELEPKRVTSGKFLHKVRPDILIPAVFFFCAIVVWSNYNPFRLPLSLDNTHQFFISERAASGVPPHVSQLSAKNSLGFLLTGVAISIGRGVGVDDIWSARALSLLVFACSVSLTAIVALNLTKSRLVAIFAALSLMTLSGYVFQVALGSRPKVFLVFFMLLAIHSAVRRRPFWLGIWTGLCFLCWQPALIMFGGAILVGIFQTERWNWLISIVTGALITLLGYEAYFWWHGVLGEQLRQSYYFPAFYMSSEFNAWMKIKATIRNWLGGFYLHPAPFLLLVVMLSLWSNVRRSAINVGDLLRDRPGWFYFSICFMASLSFTLYDQQGYPDLFFLIPFMAVLSGYGIMILWRLPRFKIISRGLALYSVGILVILLFTGAYLRRMNPDSPLARVSYTLQDQRDLAEEVKRLSEEKGDVYVIGCAHLLAFNHMDNWSKNSAFFQGVRQYLLATTTGGPEVPWEPRPLPPVVLTCRFKLPPEVLYALNQKYDTATTTAFQEQGITVWIRH